MPLEVVLLKQKTSFASAKTSAPGPYHIVNSSNIAIVHLRPCLFDTVVSVPQMSADAPDE